MRVSFFILLALVGAAILVLAIAKGTYVIAVIGLGALGTGAYRAQRLLGRNQ
jgi:hypothetical protein